MKTKKLLLMAVMMLLSVGAFAQENEGFWLSVGPETITTDNYQTVNNARQVSEYPDQFEYTSEARQYLYGLVKSDKTMQFIEPAFNAPIDIIELTDINVSGYKVIKSAVKISGTIIVRISEQSEGPQVKENYWYAGPIEPTAENYKTIATEVASYDDHYEYTSETRQYIYALVAEDMPIAFRNPTLNAAVDFIEYEGIIPGHKIVKSAIKLYGTIHIELGDDWKYYYLGTTQPTEENFRTLEPSYNSLSEMEGASVHVPAGGKLYLLLPFSENFSFRKIIKDNEGNYVNFDNVYLNSVNRHQLGEIIVEKESTFTINMDEATSSWKNIVLNSDLEGNDVSCFYSRENFTENETVVPATIIDGAGKNDSHGIVITSIDNPLETWYTQFFVRLPQAMPAGTKYRLSFDYKGSQEAMVSMETHAEPSDYIDGFDETQFTTEWQHYEREGIITEEQSPADHLMRTIAFTLATTPTATTFYFDHIVFKIDESQIEKYVTLDQFEVAVEKGKTVTLKATVSSEVEDKSVTWKSSNTSVATVTNKGVVKGIAGGIATITCTSVATGQSATCKVTVGKVSLNKYEAAVEKGSTLTLTATVYPSSLSDRSVTWKSSKTSVATVTSKGVVTGVGGGTATITCTSVATGFTATCKVTVGKVSLGKSEVFVEKGKTTTLTGTVYPSTLEDRSVTWESSKTSVATVTSKGVVKGIAGGTATITCTSVAMGFTATCKVTVGKVSLGKSEVFVEKGSTMTLTGTVYPSTLEDKSVTWISSNTAVATVTSKGVVKGIAGGTATITCTSVATGFTATCKVTVGKVSLNKYEVAVEKGKTVTLTGTVYPSSLSDRSVTWTSSSTSVATVTSDGKVTGVGGGTATITCTSVATGFTATCQVTVGKVSLSKYELTVEKGKTTTLTATVYPSSLEDRSVTWKSSNTAVATVTSDGKVKGVTGGTATITCTSVATGFTATCQVTVTESASARTLDGDDEEVTGIETIEETPVVEEPYDVYDLKGRKVLQRVTSLDGLPAGIYIVNGKKVLKK